MHIIVNDGNESIVFENANGIEFNGTDLIVDTGSEMRVFKKYETFKVTKEGYISK